MNLNNVIRTLKPGDLIQVQWRDASKFHHRRKLTRRLCATQVRTVGVFRKITGDYLVVATQLTDNSIIDGVSILLQAINDVTWLKPATRVQPLATATQVSGRIQG